MATTANNTCANHDLQRIDFSDAEAIEIIMIQGIDYLEEFKVLDDKDVESLSKFITDEINISLREETSMKVKRGPLESLTHH